eukprot:768744-Hanusia_phi.AAC.1
MHAGHARGGGSGSRGGGGGAVGGAASIGRSAAVRDAGGQGREGMYSSMGSTGQFLANSPQAWNYSFGLGPAVLASGKNLMQPTSLHSSLSQPPQQVRQVQWQFCAQPQMQDHRNMKASRQVFTSVQFPKKVAMDPSTDSFLKKALDLNTPAKYNAVKTTNHNTASPKSSPVISPKEYGARLPRASPLQRPMPSPEAVPSMYPIGEGCSLELYLVRHGETPENKSRMIAGQNSSGLTPNGCKQAQLVAERLKDIEFTAVYLSDLNRTKQTADFILRALPKGIPAFTDSRLREKAAGQYEGFQIGYIEHMTRLSGISHRKFRPPGGENWEDVRARARSFMKDVLQKYSFPSLNTHGSLSHRGCLSSPRNASCEQKSASPDRSHAQGRHRITRILIVTHGGFISEFLSSAVGGVTNSAKNCSIFVLGVSKSYQNSQAQFFLKVTNEIDHEGSEKETERHISDYVTKNTFSIHSEAGMTDSLIANHIDHEVALDMQRLMKDEEEMLLDPQGDDMQAVTC